MNVSDVEKTIVWDANGLGELTLFVPWLGEQVPFVLFPHEGADPVVTEKMAATITDVIGLPPDSLRQVKDMLWDEANFSFQVADYGVEIEEGETPLQAHLRAFEIADAEDAYGKSSISAIHIRDEFEARFAELKVRTGTETFISIVIKNGAIVDWDADGTYLGWFEEDERAAAKKRANVLA